MGRIPCLARSWWVPRAPARTAETCTQSPLIAGVVLGFGVDVLGPRRIVLEGRDRPKAVSVDAEAVDHGPAILSDQAGAQLIPAAHRPPLGHARIVGSVEWAQARLHQHLVDPLRDGRPAVLSETGGIEHP